MLKKNLWIIPVIVLLGWAALSDIRSREEKERRKNFKITSSSEALEYLNKVGKFRNSLPYGKMKIQIKGNKIFYWDNLDNGWSSQPKAICNFQLYEDSRSEMNYSENRYVKIKSWLLKVEDECWDTKMSNILDLELTNKGYLYIKGGNSASYLCVKGWN
ncbi:hypothetical protein [Tenacibaculum halocynthiae]|uniref:hypothetical protein n=1 Tax=Tenacibaculum halocynthiae TaxID=1254437 RepID=UPI003895B13C